jgi:putative membrane protein
MSNCPGVDTGDVPGKALDASISLAVDRTQLAYDRTLLAWIRTATALITFGFTIYKFFQLELARIQSRPEQPLGPTHFALLMIIIGLASLLFASLEHRRELQDLRARYPGPHRTLARVLAVLVSLLGIAALFAVVLRQ